MKWNNGSLVVMVIASVFALQAEAKNIKAFGLEMKTPKSLVVKKSGVAPSACTNFAGAYQGSCDGSTDLTDITVEQTGCDVIVINGERIEFGAIDTQATSAPGRSLSTSRSVQWTDGDSGLFLTQFGHIEIGSGAVLPFVFAATLKKNGPDLVIDGSLMEQPITCHYARK